MSNLPSFFQESFVDDTKYESLLEDLRAHDLLGPTSSSSSSSSGPPPNLGTPSKAPPPGFESGPPGLTPTKADIDWARGQHEFLKLKEDYQKQSSTSASGAGFASSGFGGGLGLSGLGLGGFSSPTTTQQKSPTNSPDFSPQFDRNAISTFQSLGLDDDELSLSSQSPERKPDPQAPPPLPPKLPPPLPPNDPPLPRQGVSHRAWVHPPPANVGPPGWRPPLPHPSLGPTKSVTGSPPLPREPNASYPPPMRVDQIQAKIMTPRDIQFVINQQTKQLRTSDPFSDDYYYYNYAQKRNRQAAAAAGAGNHAVGPSTLPLPSWKLQHVRSIDPRDSSKAAKSRSWEKQHQVLGRNDKSSLYRPRELLKLPEVETTDEGGLLLLEGDTSTEDETNKTTTRVFSNASWQKRIEIEKGIQCLLSLQDARHILDARNINIQQFHQQDEDSMGPALAELRRKTASLLRQLADIVGVEVVDADSLTVNTATFARIYSSLKGKTLLCRVLPLLHPSARFVLLPELTRAFYGKTETKNESSREIEELDQKLAKTLVVVLMYHSATPSPEVFIQCAEAALGHQTQESLTNILHDRPRAEALQALLQKGGMVCQSQETLDQWTKWQNRFVQLAVAIQNTSS